MKNARLLFILMLLGSSLSFSNQAVAATACLLDSDCGDHGSCNAGGECSCDDGYTTHGDGPVCGYDQKSRLTALLLQIFLGQFGAGEFYLQNYKYAVPQFLLGVTSWSTLALSAAAFAGMGIFYGCCFCAIAEDSACCAVSTGVPAIASGVAGAAFITGTLVTSVATQAWWVADIIRIATGAAKDGKGEESSWEG